MHSPADMETRTSLAGIRTRRIMRTAVILSVALHALVFAGIQKAFPSLLGPEPMQTYHLELIRPPVDELDESAESEGEEARVREEPSPPGPPLEDTISLNTKDHRYADYAQVIQDRLLRHWTYPQRARELLLEGRLLLVFTLSRDGAMRTIRVIDSSGQDILDQEACRAVREASPFPPIPDHVQVQRLNIRAAFDYRLTSR